MNKYAHIRYSIYVEMPVKCAGIKDERKRQEVRQVSMTTDYIQFALYARPIR